MQGGCPRACVCVFVCSRDARAAAHRERGDGHILDVPQQVLHPNLLRLHGPNLRHDVLEGPRLLLPLADLLDGVVRLGRDPQRLRLHVDDHHHGVGRVAPHEGVNLQVARLDLRAGRVPADELLGGVDLLEHGEHLLVVRVVEVPDLQVALVLLEGHRVAVCNVDHALGDRAEQHSDDALLRVLGEAIV